MTNYAFDMQLVVDPFNTSNVVTNGQVYIYDPSDTDNSSPLVITDPNGLPLSNPLMSNSHGFLAAFMTTAPQVKWVSAGFAGYFNSFEGLLDEAVNARLAAESASNDASAAATAANDAVFLALGPTDSQVEAGIARADIPGKISEALPPLLSTQVPPLVADAIAADPTVAAAAASAVTDEIATRDLVESEEQNIPGLLLGFTDLAGNRTFLEANDVDGGPSPFATELIKAAIAPPVLPSTNYQALARAAGNAANTRALTIYCIGPSTVEGAGVTNPAERYVDEMGARLHRELGCPGEYKVRFVPAFYESTSLGSAQPVRSGTATKVINTLWLGPGGRSVALGVSGTVQWTVNARQVRVHYSRTTDAGTPHYKIDNGVAVPFAASWNGAEWCGQVSPWIDLGSAGSHTFAVTSTGAGTGTIAGLEMRDATSDATDTGVHIIDAARGGYDINNYVEGQKTRQIDSMRPFKPDVIWFGDSGKNRYGGQSDSPATVAANLGIAIDDYKAAATTERGWPATVICTGSFGRGVTTVTKGTWDQYIDAMRDVVLSRGAVWFDVSELLPASQGDLATFTDTFGVYADTVHLNAEGQRWYASLATAHLKGLIG